MFKWPMRSEKKNMEVGGGGAEAMSIL
jgi:hypothetical protein